MEWEKQRRDLMDCAQVRRVLWPADALRVSDEQVARALEHAQGCAKCTRFLEEDRQVAALIRENVPRLRAPRQLRERLFTALARERAGAAPRRELIRRPRRLAAATMLVLAGLAVGTLGHWLMHNREPISPAAAFAEDYLRRVVEQETLKSADRAEIAAFFARELAVSMPPPEIPGFQIRRAVICMLGGRRGGVVEYSSPSNQVSYYLVPIGDGELAAPSTLDVRLLEGRLGLPASLATEWGLSVATWRDGLHQHAVVGNLDPEELRKLTPLFVCPLTRL